MTSDLRRKLLAAQVMDPSEFTANYEKLGDDELLCLWAERDTLVPVATMALDSELQRRGLNKQNATRIKKRFDTLAARVEKGPIAKQVAEAKYERNMQHFVGWGEPKFYSPYGRRDIRTMFASIRHKYRVWRAFRDHTGHWPVFSMWFHFLSWTAVFGFALAAFAWIEEHRQAGGWGVAAAIVCVLVLMGARELVARLVRKLDWKIYGG